MASETTNYNLHKIDLTDAPPDITVLNDNFDTIDSELKTLSDAVSNNETINEINTKIGVTTDTSGTTSSGTIFAKLNSIISSLVTISLNTRLIPAISTMVETLSTRFTADRATKIDTTAINVSQIETYTQNNNTPSATGTLSQKMSQAINDIAAVKTAVSASGKYSCSKRLNYTVGTTGRLTVLNITGAGWIDMIYSPSFFQPGQTSTVYVTVDGTTYTHTIQSGTGNSGQYAVFRKDTSSYPFYYMESGSVSSSTMSWFRQFEFSKSFKLELQVINVPSGGNNYVQAAYGVYQ